ncbi:MAG: hypothetical protein Q8R44_02520, partial [Novosphingobium sp.]|nr:hypothetical protein [Novosphingobium sp.]
MAKKRPPDKERMTEAELRALMHREVESSQGSFGAQLAEDRRQNLDYYNGELFGNEVKGRSQVVTSDVLETVESIMPSLIEIFVGGDAPINYEAVGVEDEDFAAQASDYSNHILLKDNPGYILIHDWLKDGLISKAGFLKVYFDESEKERVEIETRSEDEFIKFIIAQQEKARTVKDGEFEILETTYYRLGMEGEREEIDGPEMAMDSPVEVEFKYRQSETLQRVKIEAVPPEEMLISRRARDLQWFGHDNEPSFVGHRTRKTETQLLAMGYDAEKIKKLPSYGASDWNAERVSRYKDDDSFTGLDDRTDRGMREIEIIEGYIQVDWDGDGKAEYRKVTIGG